MIYFISFHAILNTRVCTRVYRLFCGKKCLVQFFIHLKQSGPASKPNSASLLQSLGARSTIGNWLSLSVSISNIVLPSPLSCNEKYSGDDECFDQRSEPSRKHCHLNNVTHEAQLFLKYVYVFLSINFLI